MHLPTGWAGLIERVDGTRSGYKSGKDGAMNAMVGKVRDSVIDRGTSTSTLPLHAWKKPLPCACSDTKSYGSHEEGMYLLLVTIMSTSAHAHIAVSGNRVGEERTFDDGPLHLMTLVF